MTDTSSSQPDPYPPWEEVEEKLASTLLKVVDSTWFRSICPDSINPRDVVGGAWIRLEGYYKRGIERGNIQIYSTWCGLICFRAARDECVFLTGARTRRRDEVQIELETPHSRSEARPEVKYQSQIRLDFDRQTWQQDIVKAAFEEMAAEEDPKFAEYLDRFYLDNQTAAQIAHTEGTTEAVVRRIVRKSRTNLMNRIKRIRKEKDL